jgi:hypothetical protein
MYVETDMSALEANANVKLTGSISVSKKAGKQKEFLSLTIAKKNNLVGATVFPGNPIYDALCGYDGKKIDGSLYGSVYVNGKYVNLNLANVDYYVEEAKNPKEFNTESSDMYVHLKSFVEEIDDPYIKQVVTTIYENERIMKKFLMAPASEFSAYSYLGGLATMTLDTCAMVGEMVYNDLISSMLKVNRDLLFAAALLCNIGRAYMYDIDKDGKFSKNEYGVIDSDTSLTRDAVKNAMHIVAAMKDKDDNDMYRPKNGDVVKELIHILDTSKSLIGYQTSMVPRTRNASVFASIINIVNSVGTFDKLENANIANDKLVKAFEGGKYYFIPQE